MTSIATPVTKHSTTLSCHLLLLLLELLLLLLNNLLLLKRGGCAFLLARLLLVRQLLQGGLLKSESEVGAILKVRDYCLNLLVSVVVQLNSNRVSNLSKLKSIARVPSS